MLSGMDVLLVRISLHVVKAQIFTCTAIFWRAEAVGN